MKDMRIGDDYIRGLSGGQRRRFVLSFQIISNECQRVDCAAAADGAACSAARRANFR